MGAWEWVLAGAVALVFVFIILRPDRWNTRTSRRRSDGGTTVGVDGTSSSRRDRDNDDDNDGDGGSDGGGDGGGGGGD